MQFRPSSTIESRISKKHLKFNGFNDLNNRNQNLKIISYNLKNSSDRYKLFSLIDINDKKTNSKGTKLSQQYRRLSEKELNQYFGNDKLTGWNYDKLFVNRYIKRVQTPRIIFKSKNILNNINQNNENNKKEIDIRMQFIEKLYPETKSFLLKLDNTFLSDFIANKINIDDTSEFTEKTIDKYISNVQDYYSLVQEWDKSTKEKKEGENEIDRLREEIKQKLGKFEHNRLISQELDEKMKLDYKKGLKLEEIIKKNSNKIVLDIQNPYSKSAVFTKTKKKMNMSVASTEPGNYRYGNDSTMTNKQQSSIIYPNNSSTTTKNNKSKAQNEKIAETA